MFRFTIRELCICNTNVFLNYAFPKASGNSRLMHSYILALLVKIAFGGYALNGKYIDFGSAVAFKVWADSVYI